MGVEPVVAEGASERRETAVAQSAPNHPASEPIRLTEVARLKVPPAPLEILEGRFDADALTRRVKDQPSSVQRSIRPGIRP